MINIPDKIKEDLIKFYSENPDFVFTDKDHNASADFYFFRLENIIDIYQRGKTIYDLKKLLDKLSLDKIRGYNSILYNWLNNTLSDIDIELFRSRKFILGQNISYYRDFFSDFEEIKSVSNDLNKIEFKAYGKSLKIKRSKIAFIGYFENDVLVKFDDLTSTANCFREWPGLSNDQKKENHEILPYYKNDNLLNFLIDNNLTELIPSEKLIESFESKIEVYVKSKKYLEQSILQPSMLNYKDSTILFENKWEEVDLKIGLSRISESMEDIVNFSKNIHDKNFTELSRSKSTFERYFKENYSFFKKSQYYSEYLNGKIPYMSVIGIINFMISDLEKWAEKFSSINQILNRNELVVINESIEQLKNDYSKFLELNQSIVKKLKTKRMIKRTLIFLIISGIIVYFLYS